MERRKETGEIDIKVGVEGLERHKEREQEEKEEDEKESGKEATNKTRSRQKRSHGVWDMRVVGGSDAPASLWTFLVGIKRNGIFYCGGSILSQHWVLSAAHCVYE